MAETQLQKWIEENAPEPGGGGGTEYTYTGNALTVMTEEAYSILHTIAAVDTIVAHLTVDATALGAGVFVLDFSPNSVTYNTGIRFAMASLGSTYEGSFVLQATYTMNESIGEVSLIMLNSGTFTVLTDYASLVPATLNIIKY